VRKGYRFKGRATIVLVSVEHAEPVVSPAYDGGQTETAICRALARLLGATLEAS